MKKKKAKSSSVLAPVVTEIPLPKSESALVIDLPDGQKLVVGKMENGTVIEVATWRGTGRPDSRTNRLMLGMSNTNIQEVEKSSELDEPKDTLPRDWKARLKYGIGTLKIITLNYSKVIKNLAIKILAKLKSKISREKILDSLPSVSTMKIEDKKAELDFDINEWLEKVSNSSTAKRIRNLDKVSTGQKSKVAKNKRTK